MRNISHPDSKDQQRRSADDDDDSSFFMTSYKLHKLSSHDASSSDDMKLDLKLWQMVLIIQKILKVTVT